MLVAGSVIIGMREEGKGVEVEPVGVGTLSEEYADEPDAPVSRVGSVMPVRDRVGAYDNSFETITRNCDGDE